MAAARHLGVAYALGALAVTLGAPAGAAPPAAKPQIAKPEVAKPEVAKPEERCWRVSLEAALDLPLFVAGRVTLESPDRIRASAGGGVMPAPFFAGINALVVAAHGYDRDTADLVAASLHNPGMGRFQLGWRPWAGRGWYFEAGYAFSALGASHTQETLLAAVVGPVAAFAPDPNKLYRLSATLHMLSLEAGYQWVLVDHLVLRAALGYTGTLAAHTSIRTDAVNDAASGYYADRAAEYLDGVFRRYVHLPLISVGIGGRIDGPPVVD